MGINDYDEMVLGEAVPIDRISLLPLCEIGGAGYTSCRGEWEPQGNAVRCKSLRGEIEYSFTAPQANVYKLVIAVEDVQYDSSGELNFFLDGKFLEKRELPSGAREKREITIFTPHIRSGVHTIGIEWDNHKQFNEMVCHGIGISSLAAENSARSSHGQILTMLLRERNRMEIPTCSRVSPAYLEGIAKYPELVTVSSADEVRVISANGWFAEVELAADTATPVTAAFENAGYSVSGQIAWKPTNLLQEEGRTIQIRKGDSLLLCAFPEDARDGEWQIGGDIKLSGQYGIPVPHKFTEAGTFRLQARFSSAAGRIAGA